MFHVFQIPISGITENADVIADADDFTVDSDVQNPHIPTTNARPIRIL